MRKRKFLNVFFIVALALVLGISSLTPARNVYAEEGETNEPEVLIKVFSASHTIDGITITVNADEGVFPEDATLHVEKISSDDQEKVDEILQEVREDVNVVSSYTFDIKVLDVNGEEIQPEDNKVKVSFKIAEVANPNLDTHVYHIEDSVDVLEVVEEGETLTVETDGFSFYTVEFTYNDLTYILDGGDSIALATILEQLNLVGDVQDVQVSNEELFSASNEGGDWIITSHKAFDTAEWLKVTIDGVVYEIKVTDAPEGWQDDWTYELDEDNKQIILKDYKGTAYAVEVPASANINGVEYETLYYAKVYDGPAYNLIIPVDSPIYTGSLKKLSFEKGVKVPNDSSFLFFGAQLQELDVSNLDTSNVTNMSYMFGAMYELTNLNLDGMNTSSVTNMERMFLYSEKLPSLDVSSFDTSNVTNMTYMFSSCEALTELDVSGFDTSNVTNMSYMFSYLTSLKYLDVSNLDTTKAVGKYDDGIGGNLKYMFQNLGGDGLEAVIKCGDKFYNNQRPNSEYPYPGYDYSGNYGITGPDGVERVYCLSKKRTLPQSNYFHIVDYKEYLTGRYQNEGEHLLTEDEMAMIAAAIYYEDKAADRGVVQNTIWYITDGWADGNNDFYRDWVLPHYEVLEGLFEMHIYIPENPNIQNLLGLTVFEKIEKYVDEAVHKFIPIDGIVKYDVIAYISENVDSFEVVDKLSEELELVVDAEHPVKVYDLGTEVNHLPVYDVYGNKISYEDGVVPSVTTGTDITDKATIDTKDGLKVSMDDNVHPETGTREKTDVLNLRKHWVRVEFYAQLTEDIQTKLINKEITVDDLTNVEIAPEENKPVISDEGHAGIPNEASYTIRFGADGEFSDTSNTVTIGPEKPEIEKYVNQAVHKDIDVDEVFTYDIIAYITKDADKVVIKDQLIDDLEFAVNDLSDVKIAAFEKNNHKVTNDIDGNKVNDDATVAATGKDIPIKDAVSVTKEDGLLTVTLDDKVSVVPDTGEIIRTYKTVKDLRGKWVRVTFTAQIKKSLQDKINAGEIPENVLTYMKIKDSEKEDRAEPNVGNDPVVSDEDHEGVKNTASYEIFVGNKAEAEYEDISNTVTVKTIVEYVDFNLEKIWDDKNNRDRIRPKSITVNLYADGRLEESFVVVPDENGDWSLVIENYPKYKNGKEIKYTLEEKPVKGYEDKLVLDSNTVEDNRTTKVYRLINSLIEEKYEIPKTGIDD